MRDLYLSECRRYLRPALLVFALHLLLLRTVAGDLSILNTFFQVLALAVYALIGLSLGLFQLGSYRKPSRWLWLMHRPLPRGAIFGALALASITMFTVALGLPLLLSLLGSEWFTERSADLRHYLSVPFVIMVAFMTWLVGAAIMLGASRFALLITVLPCITLLHHASAPALLAASVLCATLMSATIYSIFKPDRSAPAGSASATVATAAPLVVGMYILLLLGGNAILQVGARILDMHAPSMVTPPADNHSKMRHATSPALMLAAMDDATDARVPRWRDEIATHKPDTLSLWPVEFAAQQQLSNMNTPHTTEPDYQRRMHFNHDSMRFELFDTNTGALIASLGPGGANDKAAFSSVPYLSRQFLLPQAMLHFDPKNLSFMTLTSLPTGERLAALPMKQGRTMYLLSDKRLNAYRMPDTESDYEGQYMLSQKPTPTAPYQQQYSIALPQAASALSRIDVATLPDGTLISLLGHAGGMQHMVFVDSAGQSQIVASRTLGHDYPLIVEQVDWWLSPVLNAVSALPAQILPGGVPDANQPTLAQRPASVWAAAVMSSLLAVGGALLWRRRARHGQWIAKSWLLACLLLGLPCLATLAVMYPRAARPVQRQQRDADASRLPA